MSLLKLTDDELINSLDDLWEQADQHDGYYDKLFWLHSEVEKTLKKCPDIKNVNRIGELKKEHFDPFVHYGEEDGRFILESSSILSFDIFFPKTERTYKFDVRYDEKVIEKAHVLYNGNIFLAYSPCDDEVSLAMFGQEVREFLKKNLSSTLWEVVSVPPCPLHPDINVFIDEGDGFKVNIDEKNDVNIKIALLPEENISNFFVYLLQDLSFSVNCFLETATLNQKLNEISWNILRVTGEITYKYKELLALDWKLIKQKLNLMNEIRSLSLDIQILSNEFTNTRLKLKNERDSFEPKNCKSWNDNFLNSYFYNYFTVPSISLQETRETVKYLNEIVSNKYLHYYTIFAALAGGVAGAIITKIPSIFIIFP